MDEDGGAELLRRLEEREDARSSRFQPLTCEPISTPARPSSRTQRSSSRMASSGACMGSVPRPTKRRGMGRDDARDVVVQDAREVVACSGFAQ